MTNFHVVDNVIADTQGLLKTNGTITATEKLATYYKNNFITHYDISKPTQFFYFICSIVCSCTCKSWGCK